MKYRTKVLGFLCLLLVITYLDRVCISVAGPRMQEALHLGPLAWGWVAGIFTLSYAIFEIPSGWLGDRIGPRRVLTRIVLWWSVFTSLTGLVTGFYPLLLTRFLFGMGEAGAFPNASVAVARWFPVHERGRAFGITLMSAQLGGAFAWSAAWFWWFRDSPAEKAGVSQEELEETRGLIAKAHHGLPWKMVLCSGNFWATMFVAFCYVYTFYFFQSWFHTFLVKARGYSENGLLLSSLPFVVAACANLGGGLASNALVKKLGLKWGRRLVGLVGLGIAAPCTFAVMFTHQWLWVLILLSLAYGGITFQQPIMFAVCLDIGGEYAGEVVGAMNTASQTGSLVSSLAFGQLVSRFGSYNLPFIPMAALCMIGAFLWLKVDPTRRLVPAADSPSTKNELQTSLG